jgi:hypothetical protein
VLSDANASCRLTDLALLFEGAPQGCVRAALLFALRCCGLATLRGSVLASTGNSAASPSRFGFPWGENNKCRATFHSHKPLAERPAEAAPLIARPHAATRAMGIAFEGCQELAPIRSATGFGSWRRFKSCPAQAPHHPWSVSLRWRPRTYPLGGSDCRFPRIASLNLVNKTPFERAITRLSDFFISAVAGKFAKCAKLAEFGP